MNIQQLHEYLEQLKESVALLPEGERERERLQALVDELEGQLAADALPANSAPLADQVSELVSGFEAEHPTVAGVLNRLLVTLSSMGV